VPAKSGEGVGDTATWTVPHATYDEVVAFYEERMLEGQDFKGWDWCDTGGGVTIHAHIHSRGARDILSVSVTDDKPTGIVIVNDESGPC
jgi:hypothetical protein